MDPLRKSDLSLRISENHSKEALQKYFCAICELLLRFPRQLSCGHRCCEECVKSKEGTICPGCQKDGKEVVVDIKSSFPDVGFARDMENLLVSCTHLGCGFSGSVAQSTDHARTGNCVISGKAENGMNHFPATNEFIWTIKDFTKLVMEKAKNGIMNIMYSESYESEDGYRFAACIYPNGDGMAKDRYMSVFFLIMQGERDHQLMWPFNKKVTLTLLNQAGLGDIRDAFYPDPSSSSFSQPESDRNVPSGCPLFCPLETLLHPEAGFVQDDSIVIKFSVQ